MAKTRTSRLARVKFRILLLILSFPWLAFLLAKIGRYTSNFLSAPDPQPGSLEQWRRLEELHEMAHYAVIAGYLKRLIPGGNVLDVGCGQGILARDIEPFVGRYLGIDRDEPSIGAARQIGLGNAEFEIADAQHFSPSGMFDAIVFNESLYYLKDPLAILRRYSRTLMPDGVLIVSTVASRRALPLIQALRTACELIDETIVLNHLGVVWVILALRCKPDASC